MEFANPDLLATRSWLAANLDRPDVRIVDVRWRPDGTALAVHAVGHIPGAVHLDWRTSAMEPSDAGDGLRLASAERITEAMGRAGIGPATSVILYDDTIAYYAARTLWSLRVHGHDTVRVLEGGYPGWVEEGFEVSGGDEPVDPVRFTSRIQARRHVTTTEIRDTLGSPEVMLVDARGPAEFLGLEGNVRRLGHIPGAVNLPVAAMHVPGTQRLRDPADLREQLLRANVTRGRRLVCYDQSGVAAAKLAWILVLLGHDDVAVYDGGWAEWGARLDLPVNQ